uniref:uncharacterized protein LOC129117694 n=1 Tax=Agelaius phoeniceus TaxID=39638 RepID=UPI0023EC5DCC|nr:uncharacterized protein LOC129117694 [Agelaius phoeniceus]
MEAFLRDLHRPGVPTDHRVMKAGKKTLRSSGPEVLWPLSRGPVTDPHAADRPVALSAASAWMEGDTERDTAPEAGAAGVLLCPKCRTQQLAWLNLPPLSPPIQPVRIPLQSLPALQQINPPSPLGVSPGASSLSSGTAAGPGWSSPHNPVLSRCCRRVVPVLSRCFPDIVPVFSRCLPSVTPVFSRYRPTATPCYPGAAPGGAGGGA